MSLSIAMSSIGNEPGFGLYIKFFIAGPLVAPSMNLMPSPILYFAHIASLQRERHREVAQHHHRSDLRRRRLDS